MAEYAAVTRNEFGKGFGWYVGAIIEAPDFYDWLVAKLCDDAKICPVVHPPAGVEVGLRSNSSRDLLVLVNHTNQGKTISVPNGKMELISQKPTDESLKLDPFGVAIIELR